MDSEFWLFTEFAILDTTDDDWLAVAAWTVALNRFSFKWLFWEHCNVTGNALILGLKFEAVWAELMEAVEAGEAELEDDSEVEHCPLDGV